MKKVQQMVFMAGCLLVSCFTEKVISQTTQKEINKWYKSAAYLNGLKRTPSATINKEEFAKQYRTNKAWWDSAFSYLKHADLAALKPGRYTLYGNDDVYVTVAETVPKNKEDAVFEVHKNYADIHCVVAGREQIGIAPYASAVLKTAYDPAKDIAFYTTTAGKYYVSNASTLFIMFPEKDAHCGGVKVDEHDTATIKKVVVKVRTSK